MDLVLTGNTNIIDKVEVCENFSTSDHRVVLVDLKLVVPRINYAPRKVYLYSKGSYDEFSAEVASADWEDLFGRRTLDTKWSIFKDKYAYLVDKYIPHKMVKPGPGHKPPWTRYKSVKLAKQKRRNAWIKSRDSTLNVHNQLYQ